MHEQLTDQDRQFLDEAIKISKENVATGKGGPFGAVIVKDKKVIARGGNRVTSSNDPTAHAEVEAIRQASQQLSYYHLHGCVLYTSCEPCPMCLAAAYWARIDKIIFANTKEQAASIGFDDHFLYLELEKDRKDRSIKMIHSPSEDASNAFDLWRNSELKIEY